MRVRRLIVTRDSNIKDIEALARHPNVRDCWRLPRGFVIFESYYPVFEQIYNNDLSIKHAALADAVVRLQTVDAIAGGFKRFRGGVYLLAFYMVVILQFSTSFVDHHLQCVL
jgi:hypothetical protein